MATRPDRVGANLKAYFAARGIDLGDAESALLAEGLVGLISDGLIVPKDPTEPATSPDRAAVHQPRRGAATSRPPGAVVRRGEGWPGACNTGPSVHRNTDE